MADKKITELNELTTPISSDILPIVDDPLGSAETKKVTAANLRTNVFPDTRAPTVIVAADGSGDFTDIQDGIDDLPAGGGLVFVKDGTYNISAKIVIAKSYVTLQGSGRATIIHLNDSVNNDCIELGDGASNYAGIIVQDLKIEGNKANQTAGEGIDILTKLTDLQIINCWIYQAKYAGIDNSSGIDKIHIEGCLIEESGRYGINNNSSDECIVTNNIFLNNGDASYSQYYTGYAKRELIENNVFYHNGGATSADGVYITDSSNCVVNGNSFYGCKNGVHNGYAIGNGDGQIISNNVFEDNYDDAIEAGGSDMDISDNRIYDCGGYGINLTGFGIRVVGNIIELTKKAGIYCSGHHNIIVANTFSGKTQEAIVLMDSYNNIVGENVLCNPDPWVANIYMAIYMKASGAGNNIYNLIRGNQVSGVSYLNQFKTGIGEMDSNSDFNYFTENVLLNIQTQNILVSGAHSQAANNWYF
jgi:hypothetical protein